MDTAIGIFQAVVFIVWIGGGAYLAHRSRSKDWGYKILVYLFFTKGAILYLFFYYAPSILIRSIRAFILGMKEGREERERD